MPQTPYSDLKYHLARYVDVLPHGERQRLLQRLARQGISKSSFYRYRSIRRRDAQDIPSQKLEILATELGLSIERLKNYLPPIPSPSYD
jgi:hypothetical protein